MAGDFTLSDDQRRSLRCLAGMMIPPSAAHGVPGADDEAIFADIIGSFGRDTAHVGAVVQMLETLAGGVFADLDLARRATVAAELRANGGIALRYLTRIILGCYYRDARVMRSLEMEVRPPFPEGFVVEPGDWSLLEPVRARPKLYRDAPA